MCLRSVMVAMDPEHDTLRLTEAARWHARLPAADCTAAERQVFERWRTEPANARAYEQAERVSRLLRNAADSDRLKSLAAMAYADSATPHRNARHGRWTVPAALAASLLLGILVYRTGVKPVQVAAIELSVPAGERQEFVLADGSVVHADAGSRLNVRIGRRERTLELLTGRAVFEVAHDAARPFSVLAGNTTTMALGTSFQVQRQDRAVIVTLTEGSVSISGHGGTPWSERLLPGEQLTLASELAHPEKRAVDLQVATSWSRGRLVFRGTPLKDAVLEINRYAAKKVHLGDAGLAELQVAGNFIAGDSQSIVAAFAAVLPIDVVDSGSEIVLFPRHDSGR